jgi:antitoxin CptB|tara:strand:+ start:363 stop:617 length:255 start_codon:yes stop_codon:yes gene_type:complete
VPEDLVYNRLRWRSRRGMLELDLLLLPFFDEEYRGLSTERQAAYVTLLEQDDPDLHVWFSQKGEPEDPDLLDLVRLILDRVQPS